MSNLSQDDRILGDAELAARKGYGLKLTDELKLLATQKQHIWLEFSFYRELEIGTVYCYVRRRDDGQWQYYSYGYKEWATIY